MPSLKDAKTEIIPEQDKIILIADDGAHLKALREIVIGKLSKRGVDLRNVEQEEPAISSVGHARQELKIKQGLEGNKAKEIIQAIKSQGFKVQSQLQDRQIRVTGKKKDELQTVIQFVCSRDFGVGAIDDGPQRHYGGKGPGGHQAIRRIVHHRLQVREVRQIHLYARSVDACAPGQRASARQGSPRRGSADTPALHGPGGTIVIGGAPQLRAGAGQGGIRHGLSMRGLPMR